MQQSAFPRSRHLLLFALGWTAFAVYGSLVPLKYQATDFAQAIERFRNLPPLWYGMGARADWVANILLFVPLAFLWVGTLTCDRGRIARSLAVLAVIPVCVAGAIALEFTQIWFAGRTVSRNDILAESIGAVLGTLIWLGVGQQLIDWVRSYALDRRPRARIIWLLRAYVIGFVVFSLIPLDLTLSVAELYRKYRNGNVILVPFTYPYSSLADAIYQLGADILVFVPVGAWLALARSRREDARQLVLRVVLSGVAVSLALECVQFLVLSRYSDITDVVLCAVGCFIGARLVLRFGGATSDAWERQPAPALARPVRRLLVTLALYSLLLAVGFLYPFDFTRDTQLVRARLEDFFRVPFLSLYQGSEFNAIKQFLVRFLLFAPIGAIWTHLAYMTSSKALKRLVIFAGLVYSFGLAAGIEGAQILMPSKLADSTDAAICAAGAIAGMITARSLLRGSEAAERPL